MKIISPIHNRISRFFETFIYGGRWVIVPMYIGLLVTLVIYTWKFIFELIGLCHTFSCLPEAELMLRVLGLVDLVMIGNLILMIMIGSYSIFVRKFHLPEDDKPQWLEHISSGTLKVKIGTSLIGISSIHLLKDFIDAEALSREYIGRHVVIHIVFVLSTLAVALTDRIMHPEQSNSTPTTH